jgi:HEAT repeat protein
VKGIAVWALSRIPDERAVEPLLSLLDATDEHLKASVIHTLGRNGDPRVLEPIRHILLTDPSNALREEAVFALAEIHHERAADALIIAMKTDSSAEVRRLAAHSLRNQSGEGVVRALIEALHDEAEIVPAWARYALDEKAEEARPYLKRIYDENPEIIFRAFNTKPWEWVNASRENKYPESRAELDEMLGSVGSSIGEASAAKVTYRDRAHDCPVCSKPADQLAWFFFSTPPETWRALMGRAGWMTVCDDCHIQVDFFGGILS